MDDLVERARNRIYDAPIPTEYLIDDMADEIARLRAEVGALREALERAKSPLTILKPFF